MLSEDPFWSDNIYILFRKDRLAEFFPTEDMNNKEKLNAVSRFSVYLGILLSIYKKRPSFLAIPILFLGFTLFIYNYSSDLLDYFKDEEETKPTEKNPFMNVLVSDYTENPKKPPAADVNDPKIKKEMNKHFEKNLYIDANDPFEKQNSQREFYTMPWTTIPNDQDSWARWLYSSGPNCKSENNCIKTEDDIRHQRNLIVYDDKVDMLQNQFVLSNTRVPSSIV